MCELGLFQLIKSSFIKTGGWLLQHSHFPTQSESFKTQHAQNEIPSSMYYIDFIIDYLPRVTIWKPVRHNFFQLICLPGQLLLPSSNFPIDDDSTVKDGSSTVIIHFYPVGCNPKLSYTSFFFHEVNHHWEESVQISTNLRAFNCSPKCCEGWLKQIWCEAMCRVPLLTVVPLCSAAPLKTSFCSSILAIPWYFKACLSRQPGKYS